MTDTRPHSATHRAGPWVIDTRALGLAKRQGPGLAHPLDLAAPAPEQTETAVLSVPAGTDVRVTGLLESVAEGVLVSGTASTTAAGSCARCLQEITVDVDAPLRELYAYPESTTAQTTGEDEVPRLADDTIDLEPLVHDELVLAMPAVPLCSPDCQGLCSGCGERWDTLAPDHRHDTLDPRWAALAEMFGERTGTPDEPGSSTADPAGGRTPPAQHPGGSAGDTEEK